MNKKIRVYEIWAGGECLASFTDREKAINRYNEIKGQYREIAVSYYDVKVAQWVTFIF